MLSHRLAMAIVAVSAFTLAAACDADETAGLLPGTPTADALVSADGVVDVACRDDQCEIDRVCYDNGALAPDNECAVCRVLLARDAWSPFDAETCDDGDLCTTDGACEDGVCVTTPIECDDGDPCTRDRCDPKTGVCESVPAPEECGEDPCAQDPPLPCDDGNPCTDSACHPFFGCRHIPREGPCDDGDLCTEGDTCVDGVCVGSPKDCDDGDVCTIDFCQPDGTCAHTSIAHLCEDQNPCTETRCDPESGCVFDFNTAPCDDGNACTVGDTCVQGACLGLPIDPDDGNPCTDNFCDPVDGVITVFHSRPCDDGDACTIGDICREGWCAPGIPAQCDDGNPCTTDSCDPATGCVHVDNTLPCDDGDACTEGDQCAAGQCLGSPVSCDDGNPCTLDSCDPATGCRHELIASDLCRPRITVNNPARGATILGTIAHLVSVSGTVASGAAPITSLTLNGQPLPFNPTTGAFSTVLTPYLGPNVLVFEATDALGQERRRVQSFLWSRSYRKPIAPKSSITSPGIGVWLSAKAIDDGNRSMPPNDLATILQLVMQGFDIGSLIPSPAASNVSASVLGRYHIYIENLTHNPASVTLRPINGGLNMRAVVTNGRADVRAQRACGWNLFTCNGPNTITGTLRFSSVVIDIDLALSVSNNDIVVTVPRTDVSINGVTVSIDGIFGFLAEWILGPFISGFVSDIESSFASQIAPIIRPLLQDALRQLAFNTTLPIPRVAGAGSIPVAVVTDFHSVSFNPAGGRIRLRLGAYHTPQVTPYDNRGVPNRLNCGSGTQQLVIPEVRDLELIAADDALNQFLYAAWRGGLLEFPAPASWLSGADLSHLGLTDLSVTVSGMLAPTLSDCAPGALRATIGDLRIDAQMKLFGTPVDVVVWASIVANVSITQSQGVLRVAISGIHSAHTEVQVQQEALIGLESVIDDMIQEQLLGGLLDSLTGETLGELPLPNIDLAGALPNLPPGTSISIVPQVLYRNGGNTIVGGSLGN